MVLGLEDIVTVLNQWKDDSAQILVVSESRSRHFAGSKNHAIKAHHIRLLFAS
jgi:hypothetical protein